jgi:peptidylprolyl isomerase
MPRRSIPARALGAVLLAGAMLASAVAPSVGQTPPAAAPAAKEQLVVELRGGRVVIDLLPNLAPKHVERIKTLANQGFYNGLKFHRVIDGFMAQTGDPQGTGGGGSPLPNLQAEFTRYPFRRGTVGMARTNEPNTANSQFFICFNDQGCLGLTGQYTVWGQVVSGMEHVDKIKRNAPGGDSVAAPQDIMVKVSVQAAGTR